MTPRSVCRISLALALALAVAVPLRALEPLPSARQMADSLTDIWAEAAIREPGGPSYEFFKDLLPPLRYVNTAFRHYPIVLCAPLAPVKARYVSNGSAINARADKKPMWKEAGFPVHFRVGDPSEPFGDDLARLDGPRYAEGYLPLVHSKYTQRKDGLRTDRVRSGQGCARRAWRRSGPVQCSRRTRRRKRPTPRRWSREGSRRERRRCQRAGIAALRRGLEVGRRKEGAASRHRAWRVGCALRAHQAVAAAASCRFRRGLQGGGSQVPRCLADSS